MFTDVVNGKRAKRSEALQAFELGDLDAVRQLTLARTPGCLSRCCNRFQVLKVILSKGEFQLNEDEREHELDAMFRDVHDPPCPPPATRHVALHNVTKCAGLHHCRSKMR